MNAPPHSQIGGPGAGTVEASDLPRMILADVNLTALARDIADLWTELTPADREELVRALGTYLDGVRSRLAAPDRRAGRPAAGGK